MSQYTYSEFLEKVNDGDSFRGADLSGLDLNHVNLSRVDLKGANLKEANLKGAILEGSNLEGADLREANLEDAKLWKTNLIGADLREANLERAKLWESLLTGADLRQANLEKGVLMGANLERAGLWKTYLLASDCRQANLEGADLWEAYLVECDLREANLKDSELNSAVLNNADLRGANITGANIWGFSHIGWNIEGIIAKYVYNCSTSWNDEAKYKSRQVFESGQFQSLFQPRPTIDIVFSEGFSSHDFAKLNGLVEVISQLYPYLDLRIESMENIGLDTILRLSLSQDKNLEEAAGQVAWFFKEKNANQMLTPFLKQSGIEIVQNQRPEIFYSNVSLIMNKSSGEILDRTEIGAYTETGREAQTITPEKKLQDETPAGTRQAPIAETVIENGKEAADNLSQSPAQKTSKLQIEEPPAEAQAVESPTSERETSLIPETETEEPMGFGGLVVELYEKRSARIKRILRKIESGLPEEQQAIISKFGEALENKDHNEIFQAWNNITPMVGAGTASLKIQKSIIKVGQLLGFYTEDE